MKHFNNRNGFLLTEAMIAIAIVGLALIPILALQMRLGLRVATLSDKYDRVLHMRTFLYEAQRAQKGDEQEFTFEKKIQNPTTTLRYVLAPVAQNSALAVYKGLLVERITASWQEGNERKDEQLIHFVYRPAPEQESSGGAA